MKKIENSFAVTGFMGKDAEIRQFTTASVAKFSLAVGRTETVGEETKRVSAFMTVEVWRLCGVQHKRHYVGKRNMLALFINTLNIMILPIFSQHN